MGNGKFRVELGSIEFDASKAAEILQSQEVKGELLRRGQAIANSMNAEDHGEFRAFEGGKGKRAHVFVNAYDNHAKNAANADPSIFQRNIYAGGS